jgi:LEA14-like dessication related protein
MKNGLKWLIGLAALLLYAGNRAVNTVLEGITYGTPTVKIQNFKLLPPSVDVRVRLPIINANTFSLPLNGFDLKLYFGQDLLAPIKSASIKNIAASTTTPIDFTATVPLLGAGQTIIEAIQSGDYTKGFFLKGTVKIKGIDFPYSQKLTIQ